jgi:phosphate-selective porin OprO and OprP
MRASRCHSSSHEPAGRWILSRHRLPAVLPTVLSLTVITAVLLSPCVTSADDGHPLEAGAGPPALPVRPEDAVPIINDVERPWAQIALLSAAEEVPSPNLDPSQAGNIRRGAGERFEADPGIGDLPVLDPNQPGNLDMRLEAQRERLSKIEGREEPLPLIRLSGFFQVDDGLFSQTAASQGYYGDIQDGVGFRRARLQAIGKLTEFTNYSIEFDFAQIGRPSFFDIWGEQTEIPILGTVRVGQFRQPGTMDSWTSVRHLEFLERSAAFQASDPFRRVGAMAYAMSEDERTSWAYSVFATGLTFWDGTNTVYSTFGDNRAGTQIGDNGGVAFAGRITHLLHYDDASDGRYLWHVGAGYLYGQIGGSGSSGPAAKTYRSFVFPEFFVGDPAGLGRTAAGTPAVLDSGRILANNFSLFHVELAANHGAAHFQTEAMLETVDQFGGPTMVMPTAYFQCGYFLTGEHALYLKQPGVFDYNVVPHTPFFGTGRRGQLAGWGAWEVAFRWSYVDMSGTNINPANQLSNNPGPPPAPSLGVLNQPTVALNWWLNRYTRVQLNWIHSMPNLIGYGPAPFDIVGTRFQIEF